MLSVKACNALQSMGYPQDDGLYYIAQEGYLGLELNPPLRRITGGAELTFCPSEIEALDWLGKLLDGRISIQLGMVPNPDCYEFEGDFYEAAPSASDLIMAVYANFKEERDANVARL